MNQIDIFAPLPPHTKTFTLPLLSILVKQLSQVWDQQPLRSKAILISKMSRYFLIALNNHFVDLQKVRQEICYTPVIKQTHRKTKVVSAHKMKTAKKKEVGPQELETAIRQAFQEVEVQNRNIAEVNRSQYLVTPSKQPAFNRDEQIFPPFEPQILAQMQAEEKSFLSSQLKSKDSKWAPNLADYHGILSLGGIKVTTDKKEKKGKSNNKTVAKKIADNRIVISQGDQFLRQLEELTTKVKISKERQTEDSDHFSQLLNKVNPILITVKYSKEKLELFHKKAMINNSFHSFSKSEFHLNLFSSDEPVYDEEKIDIEDERDFSPNQELQKQIMKVVTQESSLGEKVGLNQLSRKYNLRRENKAQFFFQLLHMNTTLQQQDPQHFGDILISLN